MLAALLVAGCGAGSAVNDLGTVVKGGKGQTVQVAAEPGDRFSLAVPDTPSIGDNWSLVAVPDPAVASFISKEHRTPDDKGPGSPGVGYFVFNAKHAGTTRITLYDCWRCQGKTPSADQSKQESGEAVFELTVK